MEKVGQRHSPISGRFVGNERECFPHAGIAVFSDELRDGLCGPVWKKEKGAFLAGVPGAEMSVKFGIVGAIEHPQVRCDSVNYIRNRGRSSLPR